MKYLLILPILAFACTSNSDLESENIALKEHIAQYENDIEQLKDLAMLNKAESEQAMQQSLMATEEANKQYKRAEEALKKLQACRGE